MDVTAEPNEPASMPPPAAPAPAPTVASTRTPLARLQQQYANETVISFKSGHAMSSTIRQQVSVPAYTTAQIRQVQSQPITQSELGSLNFTAHLKKNPTEPGNFASMGRVFIIDNGAYAAKLGFASSTNPDVIHNMIGKPKAAKRKYVGAELGTVHGAYISASKPKYTSNSAQNSSKGDLAICNDFRSLSITRPHDRGYVLNWDLQAQIWALHEVFRRKYPVVVPSKKTTSSQHAALASTDPSDIAEASSHCLILTEAHLAPWNLRQKLFEFVFTTAKFGSLFVCSPSYLSMLHHRYVQQYTGEQGKVYTSVGERDTTATLPTPLQNPCCVVVDVGYSFTHVTPFFEEAKLNYAIRRLNIGGKVMTNLLRELVSFRYFNMMDQTYLISLVKERLCYVSTDFRGDLKKSRLKKNTVRRHYVLPDQTNSILGYVYGTTPTAADIGRAVTSEREAAASATSSSSMAVDSNTEEQKQLPLPEDAQVLPLSNERFSVPEVLFHPSDVGLRQAGLGEVVLQSIMACPEYLREALCANIVLVGASAAIPGLPERLLQEIRPLLPTDYTVRIHISNVPGNTAWLGGKYLATQKPDLLDSMAVSHQEFLEHGPNLPKHRFALF
jgi:actin-related protein 6